jgi:biotin carboxyl carrier protein
MKLSLDYGSQTFLLDLTPSGKSYRAAIGEETLDVEIIRAQDGRLDLLLNGQRLTAFVSSDGAKRWVTVNGRTFLLTKSSGAERRGAKHDHAGELIAPMPGQVRAVNVVEGDAVTKGQTLMLLEAMKMEIRVQAPQAGLVKTLHVKQGQTVERGQPLIEVE